MDIAENVLHIEKIIKELKLLMCNANPVDKAALYEPFTRLYASVGQGLVKAYDMGNLPDRTPEALVNQWFHDAKWEKDL